MRCPNLPKHIRTILFISCIVSLAIGCTVIWTGFVLSSSVLVQSLNYSAIGSITTACGVFLLVISIIGLYSLYKQDHRLILVCTVSSILFGLILILMSSYALHIRKLSGQVLMSHSKCLKNFKSAENLTKKGGEVMCSLYCPCEASSTLLNSGQKVYEGSARQASDCNPCENIQIYDEETQSDIVEWVKDTLNYNVTVPACGVSAKDFNKKFYEDEELTYVEFVAWMESQFGCSGMCNKQNKYLFSDVESGLPDGACYTKLKVWASENFQAFGIMGILFSVYQLALAGLFIYLYLHIKKHTSISASVSSSQSEEIKEKNINTRKSKF